MKMKRLGALLLGLLLLTGTLAGCKIEFPDDLADIPAFSDPLAAATRPGGAETATTGSASLSAASTAVSTAGGGSTAGTTNESEKSTQKTTEKTTVKTTAGSATKDKYLTDPVPEGKPLPVNPEDVTVDKKKVLTCTLSIDCLTILDNLDKLKKEKKAVLPVDGIIYKEQKVVFYEGETVFDVLNRVTKAKRIHMSFRATPIYNSNYIEGIHNLYEFDCGDLSGWCYSVNDWYPNYGCSRYTLKDGDVVRWRYTCDLGRDVGCLFLSKDE